MKLQLPMFEPVRVDETKINKRLYRILLMDLQLQMFVYDRVDETTATNVCVGQG